MYYVRALEGVIPLIECETFVDNKKENNECCSINNPTFPGSFIFRVDKVWYIKHPLNVIELDGIPHKSVHITIMHLFGGKPWPSLEEKPVSSIPFPFDYACFQQAWAVTPKGGRVGTVWRQSDGKADIYPLISTGGLLKTLKVERWASALKRSQECQFRITDLDQMLYILKWTSWYLE